MKWHPVDRETPVLPTDIINRDPRQTFKCEYMWENQDKSIYRTLPYNIAHAGLPKGSGRRAYLGLLHYACVQLCIIIIMQDVCTLSGIWTSAIRVHRYTTKCMIIAHNDHNITS